MKTRNGKIARLPKDIREDLNRRMENGWSGTKLVKWLNELPAVEEVLRDQFDGRSISKQNLSQWREGGYADWLRHQNTQEQIQLMMEKSEDVNRVEGNEPLCERLARVAAAELAEHLQRLSAVKDPQERWQQFREASLELWRLRNGTHLGRRVDLGWEKWEKTSEMQDDALEHTRRQEHIRRMQSWDEHLGFLMDLLHQPALRQWAQTNWVSREEEWQELRRIYHLKPNTSDTLIHPLHLGRQAVEGKAVYNYPNESIKVNQSHEQK